MACEICKNQDVPGTVLLLFSHIPCPGCGKREITQGEIQEGFIHYDVTRVRAPPGYPIGLFIVHSAKPFYESAHKFPGRYHPTIPGFEYEIMEMPRGITPPARHPTAHVMFQLEFTQFKEPEGDMIYDIREYRKEVEE